MAAFAFASADVDADYYPHMKEGSTQINVNEWMVVVVLVVVFFVVQPYSIIDLFGCICVHFCTHGSIDMLTDGNRANLVAEK